MIQLERKETDFSIKNTRARGLHPFTWRKPGKFAPATLPTFIFILLILAQPGAAQQPQPARGTTHVGGIMDLTKAVIHHTAAKDTNKDQTVEQIDAYHKSKGWDGIGYHFLIRKDGQIYDGRSIWKKGAHARTGKPYSRNHYIGIALTGCDEFTSQQITSLRTLLGVLGVKHIERHHEECPGKGLDVEKIQVHL